MFHNRALKIVAFCLPIITISAIEAQACRQWSVNGAFKIKQGNGYTVRCTMSQETTAFEGQCNSSGNAGDASGTINSKGRFNMVVSWDGGSVGEYTGFINEDGDIEDGRTFDRTHPASWSTWWNTSTLQCTKE
jgi:hypothetical protein